MSSVPMLKVFNDFERRPDLLARFDALLPTYSIVAIFADVMYRQNIMHSSVKPAFKAKATGQAITVQLSGGDLVDPLRALEMGFPGDVIVVNAGGDTEVSVCGGLMGGLAVCAGKLGLSPELFLSRLHENISIRHFWVGLSKAPIFAVVIALIGCLEGFQTQGTAQSVGERTTSSVVQTISLVILIDAAAAMFFMEMDW